jgi:hypothetical protein
VRAAVGGSYQTGSGTVIAVVPDGTGQGTWYCVLTADHVLRGGTSAGLAFGNGNQFTGFFDTTDVANRVRFAAPVDLAVFAVDVPNNANPSPPQILVPDIIAPDTTAGNQIVQAGYGNVATAGVGAPAPAGQQFYDRRVGSYGIYKAGTNTFTGPPVPGFTDDQIKGMPVGTNYRYEELHGTFVFTPAAGQPTTGTTYLLPGDSGGPTFESNGNGGLGLVGVHQSIDPLHGANGTDGMPTLAYPGDEWHDVEAFRYRTFISRACSAVIIPEPATLVTCFLGASVLVGFHLRKKWSAQGEIGV